MLRSVIVPSFWLQLVLREVLCVQADLVRTAGELLDRLERGTLVDCVILGHFGLDLPEPAIARLASLLRSIPVLVYGGWNTYGDGGYLHPAFRDVVRAEWRGFSQALFRIASAEGEPFPFPIQELPPVASRHLLTPRPGALTLLQAQGEREPAAILDTSGLAPRLLLAFPLHPGGAQAFFFDPRYPRFLASLLSRLTGLDLPPRTPTPAGDQYLRASTGALGRSEILTIEEGETPDTAGDRREYAAILAAEQRYYDIAKELELRCSAATQQIHQRRFHEARACQHDGYAMMLHGDFSRASKAFRAESVLWLDRHSAAHSGPPIDVDFALSWRAMGHLCDALDLWSRHGHSIVAHRALGRASGALRSAGARSSAHARIGALAVLPRLIVGLDHVSAGLGCLPPHLQVEAIRVLEWIVRRALRGEGDQTTGALLLGALLDDLSSTERVRRLVQRGLELDRALASGATTPAGWVVLTSIIGLLIRSRQQAAVPPLSGRIFLSYSREDAQTVAACHARLGELGIPAFMDTDRLHAGAGLAAVLEREARDSALFVLFVSKASVLGASAWISLETEAALGSGIPAFVPVALEDVRLPALLAMRVGIDGRAMTGEEIADALAGMLLRSASQTLAADPLLSSTGSSTVSVP